MSWNREGTASDLLGDRVDALVGLGMDREMAHNFCARLIIAGKLCERAAREQDRLRVLRDYAGTECLHDTREAERIRGGSRRSG